MARAIALHEVMAASLGVNVTDLRCLELLADEPDVTPSRLADLAGLTSGAVTGVLDRLEEAGFVRREPDPADRRRLIVRPIPARMAAIDAAFSRIVERAGGLSADLDELTDLLGRETDRLRAVTEGGLIGNVYMAPRGDETRARLVLATGAPRLNLGGAGFGQQVRMVAETAATRLKLGAAPAEAELIRATFIGPPPDVRTGGGTVAMRYRRRMLDTRSREIDARLNPLATWVIEIGGGITDVDAELRGVPFAGLVVSGGVNHMELRLPQPSGTVRLSVAGGSSRIRLTRPAGVPLAVAARGGIANLRLDGRRRSASGTDLRVETDRYGSTPDRYELEVSGGVSDLSVRED